MKFKDEIPCVLRTMNNNTAVLLALVSQAGCAQSNAGLYCKRMMPFLPSSPPPPPLPYYVLSSQGGYQALEKAVKRVVQLSIPTLRSISVKGRRSRDASRVAAILEELVPLSAKAYRVAPKLTRVELCHSATAFSKAGKAIAAGLWPALEELVVPSCHANLGHTKKLVLGLRSGRAPNLRTLNWDEQANTRCRNGYKNLNDAILSAVSAGKCPRIERLAFTFAPRSKPSVKAVMYTLRDCPTLRELRIKFKRRFSLGDRRVTFTVVRAEAAGAGQALRYSCSLSLQGRPRVSDPTH